MSCKKIGDPQLRNYVENFSRVLVTGANGFVGSCLVQRLVKEGIETHIIKRQYSDLTLLTDDLDSISVHTLERYPGCMKKIVAKVNPQIVFHLATSTGGADGKSHEMIAANITFGNNLLEAMVENGCKLFVNTGSFWQHYENKLYNPVNFYAASKQAFEQILIHHKNNNNLGFISLHLFDSYGTADPRKKILSLLRNAAFNGSTLDMTAGKQFVFPVHVSDTVEAFLLAALYLVQHRDKDGLTYFVRDERSLTLKELVTLCASVSKRTIKVNWGAKPYRGREFMCDITCCPVLSGWEAKISLEDGLRDFMSETNWLVANS